MAESAFVSCMSANSILNLITATIVWIGIIEHRTRQIVELSVGKLHSVLVHAGTHDVLQLFVLNQAVAIQIVDFEEKFDFVLGRLAGELVHGVDELLQRDGARVVFVEDLKDAFVEKWLKNEMKLNFLLGHCMKTLQLKFCRQKSHIFWNDNLLEVIAFDFLSISDGFLKKLLQSLERRLIEARFWSRVGQIGNALDDLSRRHGVAAVGIWSE